jgi:hypothetical protein
MRTSSAAALLAAFVIAGAGWLATLGSTTSPATLTGAGLTALRLGTSQSKSVVTLTRLFGRPTTVVVSTPDSTNCGVSAQGSWHALSAYFDHRRLVGISIGPGRVPVIHTSSGLRLGDTLARARVLYGKNLTTSGNNGGAWFVATPQGRIDGFLNPSGAQAQGPSAIIITMGVGVVGCPAMSP